MAPSRGLTARRAADISAVLMACTALIAGGLVFAGEPGSSTISLMGALVIWTVVNPLWIASMWLALYRADVEFIYAVKWAALVPVLGILDLAITELTNRVIGALVYGVLVVMGIMQYLARTERVGG